MSKNCIAKIKSEHRSINIFIKLTTIIKLFQHFSQEVSRRKKVCINLIELVAQNLSFYGFIQFAFY